ncbi:MAG: hypothetical protein ACKORB_00295 [Opitutia bacterium]
MTSADDFVIQFIQDKALVSPDDVAAARAAVGELKEGQNPDTAALDQLVADKKLTWQDITNKLGEEFDMEVVDVSQVSPAEELLKLVGR